MDIPAHGPDALPSLSGKLGEPSIQSDSEVPPAYNLLREYADRNPDDPYISVVGVWNADKNRYDYQAIPLYFPKDMTKEADGKVAYYGYRLKVKDNGVHRILAGLIPPFRAAKRLMTNWLELQDTSSVTLSSHDGMVNNSIKKTISGSSNSDYIQDNNLNCQQDVMLPDGTWYFYDCDELIVAPDDPNPPDEEEGPSSGGGWPDTSSDDDDGNNDGSGGCPTHCGGNSGFDESDGEEDTSGDGGSGTGGSAAVIGIDVEKLDDLPKLKCVVGNILDTTNMQDLIAEFGMADTGFDLIISGAESVEGEDGKQVLGGLDVDTKYGRKQISIFANSYLAQDRSAVEVGITYLHEAMHAEMRRYLLDNADTSTLPNFPGSITEDWENYVATRNQETAETNQENAEHIAMAKEYVDFIAQAASDFDNNRMSFEYYQALSWIGLSPDANNVWYTEYTSQERTQILNNLDAAKEILEDRTNKMCN